MQLAPIAAPPDFATLHRDRFPPMFRLAYLLTGSQEVAEELVQDAFLHVYRKWADVADHAAHLRRAVVNASRSHHRRRFLERRHPPPVEEPLAAGGRGRVHRAVGVGVVLRHVDRARGAAVTRRPGGHVRAPVRTRARARRLAARRRRRGDGPEELLRF